MDLGIFQEKNITDEIYTRGSAGYSVVATEAPSRHHIGVEVFHRPAPNFAVQPVQQFRPNFVGFQLAKGEWQCYIVGCYLAPDNTSAIESVVAVFKEIPGGVELLVAGDFQYKHVGARELPEGRGYCGRNGNRGTRVYVGALPPVPVLMVPGQEDMEYDLGGEDGKVPDGLHPGDGSPSLWECVRPVPQA